MYSLHVGDRPAGRESEFHSVPEDSENREGRGSAAGTDRVIHEGKTNHMGMPETLVALQRLLLAPYEAPVLKECAVCHQAIYDRHPVVIHPEATPKPSYPFWTCR